MTFSAACAWSLLRSLLIAAAGLAIATSLHRSLNRASGRRSIWLWTLTLLPVFVPGLLIGYGYRNFALSLVHQPFWNEFLYALLVTMQVVPVGTLILICSPPPPVSASALHVRWLSSMRRLGGTASPTEANEGGAAASRHRSSSRGRFIVDWLRHHLFALLPAASVMFLLAFQESEIATLMQASGWTEWLFTRFSLGLQTSAALKALILPVMIQLAVISAALWIVATSGSEQNSFAQAPAQGAGSRRWLAVCYLMAAIALLVGVPGFIVLQGTWEGLGILRAHSTLVGEVGIALLMSLTAGSIAWVITGQLARVGSRIGFLVNCIVLLPGLMGALALGVTTATLVQFEPLVILRDSPVPWIVAEVFFLLPRALLIRLLIGRWRDSAAVHEARLLSQAVDPHRQRQASNLLWQLDVGGGWGGLLLVCFWAYSELTLPSLLAPPGMTPAPVVLYNFMHYGQISGLSAMLFASTAIPVVLMVAGWWGFRVATRFLR